MPELPSIRDLISAVDAIAPAALHKTDPDELIRQQVATAVALQMEAFAVEMEARKAAFLEDLENAAHMICDRNISEFSRQFELQVNQSFQGLAQWLVSSTES